MMGWLNKIGGCFTKCQKGYSSEYGQGGLSGKCHGDVKGVDGEGDDCKAAGWHSIPLSSYLKVDK